MAERIAYTRNQDAQLSCAAFARPKVARDPIEMEVCGGASFKPIDRNRLARSSSLTLSGHVCHASSLDPSGWKRSGLPIRR
jgi:hypothetical protein